jgi:hypothetical protein
MQLDQVAERVCVTEGSRDGRFAAINAPFHLKRPFLGVLSAKEVSLTYFPFRRTWARQDPELSLVNVAKRVRSVRTEPSNCRAKGRAMAQKNVRTTRPSELRIHEKCF